MKLPVFSDYIKNLPKEDAEDLRFFIGNAIQPTEAPRDCYRADEKYSG